MSLTFERGSSAHPRGHAILYFQDISNPGLIVATYVVVLPIAMDVTKYIPPMFASQMTGMSFKDFSAFAVPPMPEAVGSSQEVERLAELRDDDVLSGGTVSTQDPSHALEAVNQAVQSYASMCGEYTSQVASPTTQEESDHGVNEVLYQLMSERDRLGELSKLVRTMRFAAERDDTTLLNESEETARILGRYLREQHRIEHLLTAARDPSDRGSRLSQIYLDRCYRLCDENYQDLTELDKTIADLEKEA